MGGKHRAPAPVRPKVPRFVTGAVAASALLTASGPLVMPMVTAEPLPNQAVPAPTLPMPMWTPALAALYLPPMESHPAPQGTNTSLAVTGNGTDAPAGVKHAAFTVHTAGVTGGLATRAVSAAMSQQGVPYVYGGTTPGQGLDCSALVQYAFRAAGISLPRTADAQAAMGRTVNLADIRPGDLLFFYRPITHVAVAIGNGKIVEASQPGHPVAVHTLYTSGLTVIKRVTG